MPRGLRWALAAAALSLTLLAAILTCLAHLDAPWLKRRVQSAVFRAANLRLDYGQARLSVLSGLQLRDLTLESPPPFSNTAPELLRVGAIDVRWSLPQLLARGHALRLVRVAKAVLTVVTDPEGRSSFDALGSAQPITSAPGTAPPLPLSRALSQALSSVPAVERISVEDVDLRWLKRDGLNTLDGFSARGLRLDGGTVRQGDAWAWHLTAGEERAPLRVLVEREGPAGPAGAAHLAVRLDAAATPLEQQLTMEVRAVDQTLAPDVRVAALAVIALRIRVDPERGTTRLELRQCELADAAATAGATVTLNDAPMGAVSMEHADLEADLGRLLQLVPPRLIPLALERGSVRVRARDLELNPLDMGHAAGRLEVNAALSGLRGTSGETHFALAEGRVAVELGAGGGGPWQGPGTLELQRLTASGPARLAVPEARFTLHVEAAPGGAARASLDGRIPGAHADTGAAAVDVTDARLELTAELQPRQPPKASLSFSAGELRVAQDGRAQLRVPVELSGRASQLPQADGPARLNLHLAARAGELQAAAEASRTGTHADVALTASAGSLGWLQPFLPPDLSARVSPARMGFALEATARLAGLGSRTPTLTQASTLRLSRPSYGDLHADALEARLQSHGGLAHQALRADLLLTGTRSADAALGSLGASVQADIDRPGRRLHVDVSTGTAPAADLRSDIRFDGSERALRFELAGRLERGTPLAAALSRLPGMDFVDLAGLDVRLRSKGRVTGLVERVGPDGDVIVSKNPLRTVAVDATTELEADDISVQIGDTTADLHRARGELELRAGAHPSLEAALALGEATLATGEHQLRFQGLDETLSATLSGGLASFAGDLESRTTVAAVRQDFAPGYAVEGLTLHLTAQRSRHGLIHVRQLTLTNPAGGTSVALHGSAELEGLRKRLSMEGELAQDVARAWSARAEFAGRGTVEASFRVDSPDLAVFRTQSSLRFADVHGALPARGMSVEAFNGEVPVLLDLAADAGGVHLLKDTYSSPYWMLRFADQHPLIRRASYLSIRRLALPHVEIAPFAGNLKVEQNVVSFSQLEMGARGGRITGQCAVTLDGADSTVQTHVRVTGVQSSHGEPFDGNLALSVALGERTIDGRAEILRIGRRHLLDLLDLQDPNRTNAALNRIRGALAAGYPDRVRVSFEHGFASVDVIMGGLARFLRIDEVRGIPVGPLIDRSLESLTPEEEQ